MDQGTLLVAGNEEVQIQLSGLPIKINVYYSDDEIIFASCSPHVHDKISWKISGNILTIMWQVSGIREIKYEAWFYWIEVK